MASLIEAFPGRFPSEIWQEIGRLPVGMLDEILEAKGYMHVKALVDAADTAEAKQRLPDSPLVGLVRTIEFALAHEELEKRRG